MVLAFRPPLNDHEQSIFLSLPKLNGAVVAPEYYPRHLRDSAEREFLAWCKSHDAKDWPQWVAEWHLAYSIRLRMVAKASHPGRMEPDAQGRVAAGGLVGHD